MKIRDHRVAVLIVVTSTVGAAFGIALALRPSPSLGGLQPLLVAKRFDEAERRIQAYLKAYPSNSQAHMLMAQVALARQDQKPRLALEHLKSVRADDSASQAIVLLNEGKAFSALHDYERAEASWLEALRVDPLVPEAGWALLGLYYVQGRRQDAHRLGMALHASEPDPRDRVQLLLELVRQDAQLLGFESIIQTFEPVVGQHPEDIHSTVALGLAWIRNSRPDRGLPLLRRLTDRCADNPLAWDALLIGLEEAALPEELAKTLARVPPSLAADQRFERHRGIVAQNRGDWSSAADALLRAQQYDPSDSQGLYRLSRVLRAAGRTEEAERWEPLVRKMEAARSEALPLYDETNAEMSRGAMPRPALYHRLADLREHMGRRDEALAWHRLVLQDRPNDPVSRAAETRLAGAEPPELRSVLKQSR
jgi:tetratricopeptide (TPR) repeat protein